MNLHRLPCVNKVQLILYLKKTIIKTVLKQWLLPQDKLLIKKSQGNARGTTSANSALLTSSQLTDPPLEKHAMVKPIFSFKLHALFQQTKFLIEKFLDYWFQQVLFGSTFSSISLLSILRVFNKTCSSIGMSRQFQRQITQSSLELNQKCMSSSKKSIYVRPIHYLKLVNLDAMSRVKWKLDFQISHVWVLMDQSTQMIQLRLPSLRSRSTTLKLFKTWKEEDNSLKMKNGRNWKNLTLEWLTDFIIPKKCLIKCRHQSLVSSAWRVRKVNAELISTTILFLSQTTLIDTEHS